MEATMAKQEKLPRSTSFDLPPFVGVHHPDAVSLDSSKEMTILCRYCEDERTAYRIEGAWWHEIARGGDLGQYEPCQAGKLRNAFWKATDG
jgi:hypothetical protein